MELKRSSGILLHPTSLPGPFGVGDLGPEAVRFLDALSESGQSLWQVLPLNPPGYSDSPYQCYSAFAGNPLLISPERLVEWKLLTPKMIADPPEFPHGRVDYDAVGGYKNGLLKKAYKRFHEDESYAAFREENASWLDDYALFMALLEHHDGKPWNEWEPGLAHRDPEAMDGARNDLAERVGFYAFSQYLFYRQHGELKREAAERGIMLIGDIPIFVAHNSADVWGNQDLFFLEPDGRPNVVAGVPPDYFSRTGQRWGNPLYRWDVMARDGYAWWIHRLRMTLTLYDLVRIDHFRGFEAYWEIPASEETAVNGRWAPGPGAKFFRAVRSQLGDTAIIAEDLGVITPKVEALRDRFGLPGMKVLQFAFSDPSNVYLPHNYTTSNCVVYTGTHDNDTTLGWWNSLDREDRKFVQAYLGKRVSEPSWEFIRLAFSTIARLAVVPLQDPLGLGSEARMNTPGTNVANWAWRFDTGAFTGEIRSRLRELTRLYGRLPEEGDPAEE